MKVADGQAQPCVGLEAATWSQHNDTGRLKRVVLWKDELAVVEATWAGRGKAGTCDCCPVAWAGQRQLTMVGRVLRPFDDIMPAQEEREHRDIRTTTAARAANHHSRMLEVRGVASM